MAAQTEDSGEPNNKRTLLYLKDFPERLGRSSVTIWRLRNKKKFPEPTVWQDGTPAWAVQAIELWERGYASELIAAYEAGRLENQREQDAQPGRKRSGERREAVQ